VAKPGQQRPADAFSGDVSVFSRFLRETGQPFLLLNEPGGHAVQLRFTGPFNGREVVWDCRFVTCAYQAERCSEHAASDSTPAQRCFIDIGQLGDRGMSLVVCLDLPRIDIPSIRKMIIMIRHYKRLRRGRHEFGDSL
jgi:hypothetical protein